MERLFTKGHIPWNKGKKRPEMTGVLHPFSGKHHSEESIKKMKDTFKKKYPNGRPAWNKGLHHTEETKKKVSESKKGKPSNSSTKFKKGCVSLNKGKTLSWMKGKNNPNWGKNMSGNKAPNWKGGITPENLRIRRTIEYRLWRESVLARDNWTCQKCGSKEKLRTHHIRNFHDNIDLRCSISNGIVFCQDCHKLFHKLFGTMKNNYEQIEKFIKMNIGS